MRHLSQTFSVPFNERDLQNPQLQQTLQALLRDEEAAIRQELQKQSESRHRIQKLEEEYNQKNAKRFSEWQSKLQKGEKNRMQVLEKIVKKCQLNEKTRNEKIKNIIIKKRQSMRQAWRTANQFNQMLHDPNYVSPRKLKMEEKLKKQQFEQQQDRSVSNEDNDISHSFLLTNANIDPQENASHALRNTSKNTANNASFLNNRSNFKSHLYHETAMSKSVYTKQNNAAERQKSPSTGTKNYHSSLRTRKVHQKMHTQPNLLKAPESTISNTGAIKYEQKLSQTLSRHQNRIEGEEQRRIQQNGETLAKIQRCRAKRQQMTDEKIKKNRENEELFRSYREERAENSPKAKVPPKKFSTKQRIKSEAYQNGKRMTNFTDLNKGRRQYILNSHLEEGSHYLEVNKLRHLKEILSRSIAYQSLEKKLYLNRLNK